MNTLPRLSPTTNVCPAAQVLRLAPTVQPLGPPMVWSVATARPMNVVARTEIMISISLDAILFFFCEGISTQRFERLDQRDDDGVWCFTFGVKCVYM